MLLNLFKIAIIIVESSIKKYILSKKVMCNGLIRLRGCIVRYEIIGTDARFEC